MVTGDNLTMMVCTDDCLAMRTENGIQCRRAHNAVTSYQSIKYSLRLTTYARSVVGHLLYSLRELKTVEDSYARASSDPGLLYQNKAKPSLK
ncbi:hypothetical protein AVEN_21704-1 [Araneus ventricosus]|uniref:Uncharacterized protein n=1 Tax=Araneus ventricosus TaxID=182803 RepID=A0A4Y2XAN0_ARAVE|nr:hypothetical protein AVEN_21704-1 [Araneus ventricosus]